MNIETAVSALAGLDSPEELYRYFLERDIKGLRIDSCGCPLSRYLQDETGEQVQVNPSADYADHHPGITITVKRKNEDMKSYIYSPSLYYFLRKFDAGNYPRLEERPLRMEDL